MFEPTILGTNEYDLSYKHSDSHITVTFWNGKSVAEYIRTDTELDEESAKKLFKTISGKEPSKAEKHDRSDGAYSIRFEGDKVTGKLLADSEGSNMTVYDSAYIDHMKEVNEAEKTAAKKKILEGF